MNSGNDQLLIVCSSYSHSPLPPPPAAAPANLSSTLGGKGRLFTSANERKFKKGLGRFVNPSEIVATSKWGGGDKLGREGSHVVTSLRYGMKNKDGEKPSQAR